jgi:hypothetical protein
MADTQRTRAAILALFADNETGQISPQDLRDFVVTLMNPEYLYPADFWKQPGPRNLVTDRNVEGWLDYSQIVESTCSLGTPLYLTPSGTWGIADAADSTKNPALGLATDSYAAADSQAIILRAGLLMLSNLSAEFSGQIGRPVYLPSGAASLVTVTKPTNAAELGVIEPADIGSTGSLGKWRFMPTLTVVGA